MRIYISALVIALAISGSARAGNVSADIYGGSLYLYGDARGSSITVDSPSSGQVRVSGTVTAQGENTVVNGTPNGSVTLKGWTGGIYNFSYAGNDSVTLLGLTINGAAHIDLGEGNDALVVSDSFMPTLAAGSVTEASGASSNADAMSYARSILVIGAGGADMALIDNLLVDGAATFDMGTGRDEVYIGVPQAAANQVSVMFLESCVIVPGDGADDVSIASTEIGRNLIVDDARSRLRLDISNVSVGDSTFVYGTSVRDVITTANLNVRNTLKVISEGGDDHIKLAGSARTVEVFPGIGNDLVRLRELIATRAYIYLDPGSDDLHVQLSDFNFLYAYGSSGNDQFGFRNARINQAFLYGDSGEDTFQDEGGNQFGELELFSIENQ